MATYEIMTGNEACTRAAIAAGMRFFAGYPITPATEIAELSSEMLPKVGGTYMQMEDELASIAAVIGASCTGVKAMLDLVDAGKVDAISSAAISASPAGLKRFYENIETYKKLIVLRPQEISNHPECIRRLGVISMAGIDC